MVIKPIVGVYILLRFLGKGGMVILYIGTFDPWHIEKCQSKHKRDRKILQKCEIYRDIPMDFGPVGLTYPSIKVA